MLKFLAIVVGVMVVLLIYGHLVAPEQTIGLVMLALYVTAIVGMICFVVTAALLLLSLYEKFLERRANRRQVEQQADVLVVKAEPGHQVFIRDLHRRLVEWYSPHLDPRILTNGTSGPPSPEEIETYLRYLMQFGRRGLPRGQDEQSDMFIEPGVPNAVDLLDKTDCGLIVGERDAGKTSILMHLVERRLPRGSVLVIDPHAFPNKWPSACSVVGIERNYAQVMVALNHLMAMMAVRYREIGRGEVSEGGHPLVTLIVDEWRAIQQNLGKPATDILKSLLAESRKVRMDMFVTSHSRTVKALGIEGEGDLRDGFLMVALHYNKVTEQRSAVMNIGNGDRPVFVPAPNGVITVQEQARTMFDQGMTISEIAERLLGSKGGPQNNKIKGWLIEGCRGVKV